MYPEKQVQSAQHDGSLKKKLNDLDGLILTLPAMLHASKVLTLKRQAARLQALSESFALAVHLSRPDHEIWAASNELLVSVRQFSLLASKSRLSQDAQIALRLLVDLALRLHADLGSDKVG
jgi:hypothetical protein